MNRRYQISAIIEKRHQAAENIARLETNLQQLFSVWHKLEDYCQFLQKKIK